MNKLVILVAFVVGIVLIADNATAADKPDPFPPQIGSVPAPKSLAAGLSSFNDGEGALKTLSRVLRAAEDEENKANKDGNGKRNWPGLKGLRERLGRGNGKKGEKEGEQKDSN